MEQNENQIAALTAMAEIHNANINAAIGAWQKLQAELDAVRDRHRKNIAAAIERHSESRVALYNAVAESDPAIWEKTKSIVAGCVKAGWRKKKGAIVVADESDAVARLKKMRYDNCIKRKEVVDKTAARQLPADILAKAGIMLSADTDEVVVSAVGDAVKDLKRLADDGWMDE